jgi:peptide deformylase
MILPIVAYGSPILKKECEEIDKDYPKLGKLVDDMFETMYNANGIGLAAPQIDKGIRLFIVDASPFAEDDEDKEFQDLKDLKDFKKVFINPIIYEEEGKEWTFNEGCLSIPGVREDVKRKPIVRIEYYDENWELQDEEYDGIAARIIQHEYDHIEGILFTDHLSAFKRQLAKKALTNISKGMVDVTYRMKFPNK